MRTDTDDILDALEHELYNHALLALQKSKHYQEGYMGIRKIASRIAAESIKTFENKLAKMV